MIDETLLQKLSLLARVAVDPADVQQRLQDFQSILGCIGQINAVELPSDFAIVPIVYNHARADVSRPASADTVAGIINNFPSNVLGQLRVQQVLKK